MSCAVGLHRVPLSPTKCTASAAAPQRPVRYNRPIAARELRCMAFATEILDLTAQTPVVEGVASPAAPGGGISTSAPRLLLPDVPENRLKLGESPIWCVATNTKLHSP